MGPGTKHQMTPRSNISANKKWANDTLGPLITADISSVLTTWKYFHLFSMFCSEIGVIQLVLDLLWAGQLSPICILTKFSLKTPGVSSLELSLPFGLFVNLTPLICTYFNLWLGLWPSRGRGQGVHCLLMGRAFLLRLKLSLNVIMKCEALNT